MELPSRYRLTSDRRRWLLGTDPSVMCTRAVSPGSGFIGKRSEVALDLAIPLHARDGPPPTTLHLLQGRLVIDVAGRDCLSGGGGPAP